MDDEIDLRQYLSVLWRRRYTIVAVTLFAVVAALLLSFLVPGAFEAEAIIQLSEHSAPAYGSPSSAAQVLMTRSFLDATAKRSGIAEDGRGLQRLVKAAPLRDTRMLRITVRYRDPRQAKEIADSMVQTFISRASERVEQKRNVANERLKSVNAQLAEIRRILQLSRATLSRLQEGSPLTGEERGFIRSAASVSESLYSALYAAQSDLNSTLLTLEPPSLIQPALLPREPVAPRKVMNTILATILGLMAGTVLAFVLDFFSSPAP